MLFKCIICFLAGAGAGIGTGFAGMSAAAVITPMLVSFLGMDSYQAVGIALASDVLASAVSAFIYKKNDNLDIRNGFVMMIFVLIFTLIGSWLSSLIPEMAIGNFSILMTFVLGIKFLVWPVTTTKNAMANISKQRRTIQSILCGAIIGSICGFVGAGGGMMMLLLLVVVMGYELKTAVGTSVFIMTFTAFTGAAGHFLIAGISDPLALCICIISTLLWARIAARIANKSQPATLNKITGIVLLSLGILILLFDLFG